MIIDVDDNFQRRAYGIFIHFQLLLPSQRVSNKIVAKRRQRDTKWLFPGAEEAAVIR